MIKLWAVTLLLLTGCAGIVKSEKYSLLDVPCQSAEVTTSWQGKQMVAVCGDSANFEMAATQGHATMNTVNSLLKGAFIGAGLGIGLSNLDLDLDWEVNNP